jgi:hypothetical protein
MAFPSDGGTLRFGLAEAWQGIRRAATQLKQASQQVNDASLAGPISSRVILNYVQFLADKRTEIVALAAVPGLDAYGEAQIDDPTLDLTAEYVAMRNALDAARDWIVTNFPKNGGGFLLAQTLTAQGLVTDRQFPTADLATFRTQLQGLIAAID